MAENFELIIIGGGPAGLAAAVYAGRADRKVLLLERGLVGGQVAMTMDIANYPGFPEGIDGPALAQKMRAQAERYGVEFRVAEARDILRNPDETFSVATAKGDLAAPVVVIATGSSPKEIGVPGEKELRGRGVSYCGTCDAPFFRNRNVLVIGGGDTALKEALHLSKFAASITIVHRRDSFRAEKIYQKQVLSNEKIKVIWNARLSRILGEQQVGGALLEYTDGRQEEVACDGVFIFVGTNPNTSLICRLIPANCRGHIDTDADMMTSLPGLFAVGDVREHSYRQVATAVGEGATAAMAAEHYLQEKAGE